MDPLLTRPIEGPRPYRTRRLLVAAPLVVWVVATICALCAGNRAPGVFVVMLACEGIVLANLALPFAVAGLWETVSAVAGRVANRRALAALDAGDPATAEAEWRRALDRRLPPHFAATLTHNVGVAALLSGDLERAAALMDHALATGWFETFALRRFQAIHRQGRAMMAIARGDCDAAEAELSRARLRLGRKDEKAAELLAVTEAMALLRRGAADVAAARLRDIKPERLPDRAKLLARLCRAFALQQCGADASTVAAAREGGLVAPKWARVHWPALWEFAEGNAPCAS